MNTLRFRNMAQKVLWDFELSGQLSDGRWENSRPYDHWEYWHRDVATVVDPDHVGRDFYVRRDGYCFTEKDLLEVVGARMLNAVRNATANASYSHADMVRDLRDIRAIIKIVIPRDLPIPLDGQTPAVPVRDLNGFTGVPAPAAPVRERSYTFADFLECNA